MQCFAFLQGELVRDCHIGSNHLEKQFSRQYKQDIMCLNGREYTLLRIKQIYSAMNIIYSYTFTEKLNDTSLIHVIQLRTAQRTLTCVAMDESKAPITCLYKLQLISDDSDLSLWWSHLHVRMQGCCAANSYVINFGNRHILIENALHYLTTS